jgi:hypothetical protein
MNVEIGTKAAQFSEKEYIIGISVAVQGLGCLWKRLLEFRESRNFIRKWSYFRDISSDFVYFRITFYTTFSYNLAWFPFENSNKYKYKLSCYNTVFHYELKISM